MREKTMKKLLGISFIAMLAVTPMMAEAGQAIPVAGAGRFADVSDTDTTGNTQIATTNYVKGAYNAVQGELRSVANDIDLTVDGKHIDSAASVAENLVSLDSAVTANDNAIGVDANGASIISTLTTNTDNSAFDTSEAHGNIVEAIMTTKTQAKATDALIGDFDLDGFASTATTVTAALQELKNANNTTDNKVVAVYSKWNGGADARRNSGDYARLYDTSALANVDTGN